MSPNHQKKKKGNEHGRSTQPRRLILRYERIFLGYCYTYHDFGHKAVNCSFHAHKRKIRTCNLVCNKYWNIAIQCRKKVVKVWKMKDNNENKLFFDLSKQKEEK